MGNGMAPLPLPRPSSTLPSLRACDFFEFNGEVALITKELGALERPKNQKSHKLSG